MGKKLKRIVLLLLVAVFLTSCAAPSLPPESTSPPTTELQTEEPTAVATNPPEHSPLYIPGLDVADVITYFNEVCLDAEFVDGGDASLLQKWTVPICYSVNGEPTQEDLEVLRHFASWLNTVEGFPGISEAGESDIPNLQIYFCSPEELVDRMGEGYTGLDGAVTFWYSENEIYDEIICIRTDLSQETRNSVILEELYNGLGPVQDTALRPDSLIYSEFSTPQELTEIDELLIRLLYHPSLVCGWDANQCEAMIRKLYY